MENDDDCREYKEIGGTKKERERNRKFQISIYEVIVTKIKNKEEKSKNIEKSQGTESFR